jgi:hypothetical protein
VSDDDVLCGSARQVPGRVQLASRNRPVDRPAAQAARRATSSGQRSASVVPQAPGRWHGGARPPPASGAGRRRRRPLARCASGPRSPAQLVVERCGWLVGHRLVGAEFCGRQARRQRHDDRRLAPGTHIGEDAARPLTASAARCWTSSAGAGCAGLARAWLKSSGRANRKIRSAVSSHSRSLSAGASRSSPDGAAETDRDRQRTGRLI